MRQAFAHEARLAMDADADIAAPGAAITRALCGHWDHPPPCPVAPHHTAARRLGEDVLLRVLFAVDPTLEEAVRGHIEAALARGHLDGPHGAVAWTLTSSRRSDLTTEELAHAERLVRA